MYKFLVTLPDELGFAENAKIEIFKKGDKFPKKVSMNYLGKAGKEQNSSVFIANYQFAETGEYYYRATVDICKEYTPISKLYICYDNELHKAFITKYDEDKSRKLCVYQDVSDKWKKCRAGIQIFVDTGAFDKSYFEKQKANDQKARVYLEWDEDEYPWKPNKEGEYINNSFFGGNLLGIIDMIPKLKERGYDIIYLTPIWDSNSNNRYDSCNYLEIDQIIGSFELLRKLTDMAHKHEMLVICDFAFNHVSSSSKYMKGDFIQRRQDGSYEYWYDFKDFALTNKQNLEFLSEVKKCLTKYLVDGDIDGIRLDLAMILPLELLKQIYAWVKEIKQDAIIYGEVWENASFMLEEQSVDSVMNYPLLDSIIKYIRFGDVDSLKGVLASEYRGYPEYATNVLMNLSGSHDTATLMFMLVDSLVEDLHNRLPYSHVFNIEDGSRYHMIKNGKGYFDTYGFRKEEKEHDTCTKEQYDLGIKLVHLAKFMLAFLPGIPFDFATQIWGAKDPFNRKVYEGHEDENFINITKNLSEIRRRYMHLIIDATLISYNITNEIFCIEVGNKMGKFVMYANRTQNDIKLQNISEEMELVYQINSSTKDKIAAYGGILYVQEY